MNRLKLIMISAMCLAISSGCATVKLDFLVDKTDPLEEQTVIDGTSSSKILLINIDGFISQESGWSFVKDTSSMVEDMVSQLKLAAKDRGIKAVLLKVNSPGGTATASDIIYHEIMNYKKKTGCKIYVHMMDIAASGGYMVSLPADRITAQPTTVTGSVGIIFIRPKIDGLCEKIGVSFDVTKSGENKDMGSPFRKESKEEEAIFQSIITGLNDHFYSLVQKHRKISPENLSKIKTARVFLAGEALKIGMIDGICYPDDAILGCILDAGLDKFSKVVVYRRKKYPNDNIYNTSRTSGSGNYSLVNLGVLSALGNMKTGFCYVWPGALMDK
jgi:protease-4